MIPARCELCATWVTPTIPPNPQMAGTAAELILLPSEDHRDGRSG